jgi:hypothetical protein
VPIVEAVYAADLEATLLSADCGVFAGPKLTALCNAIAAATVRAIHTATVTVPSLGLIAPGGLTPAPVTGAAVGAVT